MAHKALRQGYFWPSLKNNTMEYFQRCDKCQRFMNYQRAPSKEVHLHNRPKAIFQMGNQLDWIAFLRKKMVKYVIFAIDYVKTQTS